MSDIIYWFINHRHIRAVFLFCYGISLIHALFLFCFLRWKRDNILWKGKKPCLTLSFDCDYEEDVRAVPQILDLLEKYEISASFACIGRWIEKFPEIHKAMIDKGHEIINHSYSHPDNEQLDPTRTFKELNRGEKKQQIERCHRVCTEVLGYEPTGFRTPHFNKLFSEEDYQILSELNYTYSSSTVAVATPENGQPFLTKEGILEFPVSPCPKHPFAIFSSWHTTSKRTPYSRHRPNKEFYKLFRQLTDIAIGTNSYINLYLDPQDIVEVESFEDILKYLRGKSGKIWLATYAQIVSMLTGETDEG